MTGPDLSTELRRRAEATAESIRESARMDAERLAAEADQAIEKKRRQSLRHQEAGYRAQARTVIAAERHAAMQAVLVARSRLVDRVFEEANRLLPSISKTEAYLSTIASQLGEALQFVGDEGVFVRCAKDLVPTVRDAVQGGKNVTVEADPEITNGFIVVGEQGSVKVDDRLEARLERLKEALAIEIYARLEDL